MENSDAHEIIRDLANGMHPITCQELPADSVYNHPQIVRALFVALDRFPKRKRSTEERQKENLERGLPKNSGLPWSDEARNSAAKGYTAGESIEKIAEKHQRSSSAIAAELTRQGLITPEQAEKLGYTFRNRTAA
ncbi:MAG: hypothetical protein KDD66_07415 [Bdellovibrionales bacterium]|nr:hypothetical protein [Bdellovibrionales bacterium]